MVFWFPACLCYDIITYTFRIAVSDITRDYPSHYYDLNLYSCKIIILGQDLINLNYIEKSPILSKNFSVSVNNRYCIMMTGLRRMNLSKDLPISMLDKHWILRALPAEGKKGSWVEFQLQNSKADILTTWPPNFQSCQVDPTLEGAGTAWHKRYLYKAFPLDQKIEKSIAIFLSFRTETLPPLSFHTNNQLL